MTSHRLLSSAGLAVGLLALVADASAAKNRKPRAAQKVNVKDVFETPDGEYVVILRTEARPYRYLPIWIGESEALAIRLRLDRHKPPRPLTLNLLESVMSSGRIKLVDIAIDDLKGGVFLGRLHLRQGGRLWKVEARPSDAIGLALGNNVPIWVADKVLKRAAFDPKSLQFDDEQPDPPTAPGKRPNEATFEETL